MRQFFELCVLKVKTEPVLTAEVSVRQVVFRLVELGPVTLVCCVVQLRSRTKPLRTSWSRVLQTESAAPPRPPLWLNRRVSQCRRPVIHKINEVTCIVTPHVNTAALTVCVCVCYRGVEHGASLRHSADVHRHRVEPRTEERRRSRRRSPQTIQERKNTFHLKPRRVHPIIHASLSSWWQKTSSSILSFTLYFLTAGNKKLHQSVSWSHINRWLWFYKLAGWISGI